MPERFTPGVYVDFEQPKTRTIQGAGTSTAAFVGVAERGPVDAPVKIRNFTEFLTEYGGFQDTNKAGYLHYAVYLFFQNGGRTCYISRVDAGETAKIAITKSISSSAKHILNIAATSPGEWPSRYKIKLSAGSKTDGVHFGLAVIDTEDDSGGAGGKVVEQFDDLNFDSLSAFYFAKVLKNSHYVSLSEGADLTPALFKKGTSISADSPTTNINSGLKFGININGDGRQEVTIVAEDGSDLATGTKIKDAIQKAVRALTPNKVANAAAYSGFTAAFGSSKFTLTSGVKSPTSTVVVTPSLSDDASALLKLGKLQGGTETGGAVDVLPVVGDYPFDPGQWDSNTNILKASSVAGSSPASLPPDASYRTALNKLKALDDLNIVAIPGKPTMIGDGLTFCKQHEISFFVADPDSESNDTTIVSFRASLTGEDCGALYYPWVKMENLKDPNSTTLVDVPPSGAVAGVFASTDLARGVFKAPAGTAAKIQGIKGLASVITDGEQEDMNKQGINALRTFSGVGSVIWGTRTLGDLTGPFRYVPVKRYYLYLRQSLKAGTQFAVFEPNNESLWSSLRMTVEAFMMREFRNGSFQGATPEQSFFVKCDAETNPQSDIDAGYVNILVGYAPVKPAEFVIIKISHQSNAQ